MNSYNTLIDCLERKGVGTHMQNDDQLVVSARNPAVPNSNCFWVTARGQLWYLGTFLPAVYEVVRNDRLCEACEAVYKSSQAAIYVVDASLVERFELRRLSDAEMRALGFA